MVLAALRRVLELGLGPRRPTAGLGEEEKASYAERSSAKWHCCLVLQCSDELKWVVAVYQDAKIVGDYFS